MILTPRSAKAATAVTVSGVAAIALSACGGSPTAQPQDAGSCPTQSGPVAIVTGRANSPQVDPTLLAAPVNQAAAEGQTVYVIDAGGTPQVAGSVAFTSDAKNDVAKADELKTKAQQLQRGLASLTPASGEANPLAAVALAARSLKAHGTGGTLVVADSGLQTVAPLDYREPNLAAAEPVEVADGLAAGGELPDLAGIRVVLVGIGDTALPQQPASTATRNQLVEQWKAITAKAGASCVQVDPSPVGGAALAGAPAVTVVALPKVEPLTLQPEVKLDSQSVAFKPESSELRAPEEAHTALSGIAAALKSRNKPVALTGTTATDGSEEGRLRLSQQRAEAVKALLVQMGVPAELITTSGVGTNHPLHVQDLDAQGNLVPELAAQNRAVYLKVSA